MLQAHKIELYQHCLNYVQNLIQQAQSGLKASQAAANSEEKSSAGDKFETNRAMMHLQMESFIKRLDHAQQLEKTLLSITLKPLFKVGLGALVETDRGWYFIGVSAPKLSINHQNIACISTESPLFKALQGKQKDDWAEFNHNGVEDYIEVFKVL